MNIPHKYSGVLSLIIDLFVDNGDFVFVLDNEAIRSYRAMLHSSQSAGVVQIPLLGI